MAHLLSFVTAAILGATLVATSACSSDASATTSGGGGGPALSGDAFDVPIDGVTVELEQTFFRGDDLFDLPLRDADGLGPLYTRASCGACHDKGVRGPGTVQKMEVMLDDGITPSSDQSKLPYGHTVHPLMTAGATTPIVAPQDPSVLVTLRVGPPILGRGFLEAVLDSEIERVAAEQAQLPDIHGRVNHVIYQSEPNPDPTFNEHQKGDTVIGRFGLKARIATLDEFTADALQGDMGITSPLRPTEFANPDGLTDDLKPGVDVDADSVNRRAMYVRLTAIPRRINLDDRGRAAFERAKCSTCHVPTLKTRADYPIPLLAGIDAPIYTDFLLHDMGDDLADGQSEGEAGPRDWRTPPLIGLRFNKVFLHDGRADTVEDAILKHTGNRSEAASSVDAFNGLSAEDHAALIAFVSAL